MGIEHQHHLTVYGPPWSEGYRAYCKCGWQGGAHHTRAAAVREYEEHVAVRVEGPNALPGTPIPELI